MKWVKNACKVVFQEAILLLFVQEVLAVSRSEPVSILRDGGFEAGVVDLEVYRYPRYTKSDSDFKRVQRSGVAPLSGRYSLLVPGAKEGGYRLDFPVFPGYAKNKYHFEAKLGVGESARVSAEVFVGKTRVFSDAWQYTAGRHSIAFEFDGGSAEAGKILYRLVVRVKSITDVRLDDLALYGGGRDATKTHAVILEPDHPMGVYGIGESGEMRVAVQKGQEGELRFKLRDTIDGNIIDEEVLKLGGGAGNDGYLQLHTSHRGAYQVEIYEDKNKIEHLLARKSYVVINRMSGGSESRAPYGIAMEEHGQRTHIDAKIMPDAYYQLAEEIGAGNVRLFTSAMPDMLSGDGFHYDFSALDRVLKLCQVHGLTPLVELGSNLPNRIPAWLRVSVAGKDSIDLRAGVRTKKLKKKLSSSKGGRYLDLGAYRSYLKKIFSYLAGRVEYFEIWNEPGHKFRAEDFKKLASLTRQVQTEFAPQARLLGFSSTKGGGTGMGSDPQRKPQFLKSMLESGGEKYIDILSYHSGHAFQFMGKMFDHRDEETKYVGRMRDLLKESGADAEIPIWDTERGIPWKSPAMSRVDRLYGLGLDKKVSDYSDVRDVARRLPAVYAAAFASGVEKVFWFYMDSSTQTIAKTNARWGLFDAQLEPMPHLAAYDAMTEILGAAKFEKLLGRPDGVRAYFFSKGPDTVILIYNWSENIGRVSIEVDGAETKVLNVMGNLLENDSANFSAAADTTIPVDGWPRYLIIKDRKPAQIMMQ